MSFIMLYVSFILILLRKTYGPLTATFRQVGIVAHFRTEYLEKIATKRSSINPDSDQFCVTAGEELVHAIFSTCNSFLVYSIS